MRSWSLLARVCAATGLLLTTPVVALAQTPGPASAGLIPAIQVDGRGHGHGVGMAQDGALAMGKAGASVKDILTHFYPGTALGKGSGNVRVPVFSGNGVELLFPDGGEIRGGGGTVRIGAGGSAFLTRDGDGTRVRTGSSSAPTSPSPSTTAPSEPSPTTSTTSPEPTTTTTTPPATTSTTTFGLTPQAYRAQADESGLPDPIEPNPPTTTTSTSTPPAPPSAPTLTGALIADPNGGGRVGIPARGRRYRGTMEIRPASGGLRFVNEVNVETYLRGMGEVRNPSWPAAGLQAQAIAARTYALRAMNAGGELCDSQRCQVYIGSDAEYAAMDKAVSATSGQVLTYGKSLASAVYSANAGGVSADKLEGFGTTGEGYPYLRAVPYLTNDRGEWSVTIALSDVARRLNYRGTLRAVTISGTGGSGRATSVTLSGDAGDKSVRGLDFDASLGLKSTLFTVKFVMASKVATLKGGFELQAPPDEAAPVANEIANELTEVKPKAAAIPVGVHSPIGSPDDVGFPALVAAALWGAAVALTVRFRVRERRTTRGAHFLLS